MGGTLCGRIGRTETAQLQRTSVPSKPSVASTAFRSPNSFWSRGIFVPTLPLSRPELGYPALRFCNPSLVAVCLARFTLGCYCPVFGMSMLQQRARRMTISGCIDRMGFQ